MKPMHPTTLLQLGVTLRRQSSFGVPSLTTGLLFLGSLALATVIWLPSKLTLEARIEQKVREVPSPLATLLLGHPAAPAAAYRFEVPADSPQMRGTAIDVQADDPETGAANLAASVKSVTGTARERHLVAYALARMGLRDASGNLYPEAEINALARHFCDVLNKNNDAKVSLFSRSAPDTLARFFQECPLNGVGERPGQAPNAEVARGEMVDALVTLIADKTHLAHPAEIVSAPMGWVGVPDKLGPFLIQPPAKSISADTAGSDLNQPFVANTATDTLTAQFESQHWTAIHQVLVRLAEMCQTDEAVRAARYRLTYVDGADMCLMFGTFLFACALLGHRWRQVRAAQGDWEAVRTRLGRLRRELADGSFLARWRERRWQGVADCLEDGQTVPLRMSGGVAELPLAVAFAEAGLAPTPEVLAERVESTRATNERSRWMISTTGRVVPTLGFIAKVGAIAAAMQKSPDIARAIGAFGQSAAISEVSGALGVAFTATFLAFGLCIILWVFDAWESHLEHRFIDEVADDLGRPRPPAPTNTPQAPQPPNDAEPANGRAIQPTQPAGPHIELLPS